MKKIVIFASGTGSNAQKIVDYFNGKDVEIALIVSNNKNAKVLEMATTNNIKTFVFKKNWDLVIKKLTPIQPDLIILAGFLLLIPSIFIHKFQGKIINIHPSLLPKYGGKGMYGLHVHKAVKAKEESNSGITIHFVNEKFDEGKIIFQASTILSIKDTAEDIAAKVLLLEHFHFPREIEKILSNS